MTAERVGRVWALEVVRAGTATIYEGIDFRATARWPGASGPPTVDLEVFHPPQALISQASDPDVMWRVRAGYASSGGAIEIGGGPVIRDSAVYRRGSVDPSLSVQLASRAAVARVVLVASFEATTALDLVDYIRLQLGLAGDIRALGNVSYTRGYVLQGTPAKYLDQLARDLNCTWTIEGATLRMWPSEQAQVTTADLWSPSTGLLETPQTDAQGRQVRASAWVRPAMRPGMSVRLLDPAGYAGDVVITEAEHVVDTTLQGDWRTSITARPR